MKRQTSHNNAIATLCTMDAMHAKQRITGTLSKSMETKTKRGNTMIANGGERPLIAVIRDDLMSHPNVGMKPHPSG